ncbi:Uncharacterised protein [Mycobacterium tuberculosis]|uniref:Uncharacterized protein n=1 Tax=Mycobacterium tuberculosis TaxID=1773 RepID=A0A916LIL7_MYCTX|nr:Uncharacterised protein [Mycobacterium tuberculosis]CPC24650.1 Uncharacterised protein [Mycobacterium tuberculosis]SIP66724.1 conserved hypothetical protein [Mycobacterium tuberculosis]
MDNLSTQTAAAAVVELVDFSVDPEALLSLEPELPELPELFVDSLVEDPLVWLLDFLPDSRLSVR